MSKTILIFSTKGGVGKTFIATNIAVSLSKDENKRVCLVDLDLHAAGDMARMLDLSPQRSMADLTTYIEHKHTEDLKKEHFSTHSKYGIDFLPGILKPQQSPHLKPARLKDVFRLLAKEYDYIILDVGKLFTDVFICALNQANLILLVVTPDVLAIYQAKWMLDVLQTLHFPLNMMKLILNRAESISGISWQEVGANLPVKIISLIPSEGRVVGQSVNKGIPIVVDSPRTKVSYALKKLSHELASDDKLFIDNREVDLAHLKEVILEKSGEFWQSQGLTEALTGPSLESEAEDMVDAIILLKRRIHSRLIEDLNIKRMDLKVFSNPEKVKSLKSNAEKSVVNLLAEEAGGLLSSVELRTTLVKEIIDEALGLGPLEDLLRDPEITDIMVNNKDEVYVERRGKIERTQKKFISNEQVRTIIERVIAPLGRRIDESVPMVDARLPDGSRINAIIPPLSLTGPTLTIRKFRKERFGMDELISLGTLSPAMGEFLKACVLSRKDIVVSGGTGSGKTTFLSVLSAFISATERIVTIEDAAELKLHQQHWVRLESRPPSIEGKGAIATRDLFRNTLRMRPDRIIIGECRGAETMDMLQAMNTGHDGSMTTIHANSTQDVLTRLDSMILMSNFELPIRAIREMIASAIDIIVHTARLSDGSRKVTQITEVTGMLDELHVGLKDIFNFRQTGLDAQANVLGNFEPTGYTPSFIADLRLRGISLSDDIFKK